MPDNPWEVGVVLVWGLYLAWAATTRKPNFASWHMFAGVTHTRFKLHDGRGRRFNCWQFLPHSKLGISLGEAELLLIYVSRVHGMTDLVGTLVHRSDFATERCSVVDSELVR